MANSLDNFEICGHIGKGSYGEVKLARHKRDRKQYVLKKINLKKASVRERRSAELEAKLLSKLKHPNIVSYKDSFEHDGLLYIAMQYCEGGDLYNKLKEQRGVPLEERQLVEWFVQIAMAMQYMHERNILHRDLKTQNIFLTKSKIIKVGDLGIARVLDNSSAMATTLIGTPYYMSPELFSNKPYNHKSDVWALGCCVYEMLTLKHAFNARDMNSLVYKILRGKIPPMPKQYTADLVTLIRNMLNQDPSKRPTVNRILRDPYIKKNIAIFLEETKQSRRPSGSARSSRPGSASSQRSISSIASSASSRQAPTPHVARDIPDSPHASVSSSRSEVSSSRSEVGSSRSEVSNASSEVSSSRSEVSSSRSEVNSERPEVNSARSEVNSARSVVSVSNVEVGPMGDHQQSHQLLSRPQVNHRRTPSGGMRPDLEPIREGHTEGHMVVVEGKMVNSQKIDEQKDADSDSNNGGTLKAKSLENGDNIEPSEPVQPPSPSRASNAKRKKKSILSKYSQPGSARSESSGPVQVDVPRPLPPPPKIEGEGLPQRRVNSYSEDKPHSSESKSSSTSSSSKDENISLGDETPRSLPNLSARERRRRKDAPAQSYVERPHSARVVLKPNPNSKSTAVTQNERKRYEGQYSHRHRQPSLADDSSSSDEDTLKENENQKHSKEKHRENKEMKNFISLLDTTLQLNKDDDKSDEESKAGTPEEETPRIPKSSSMPSVDTLCNADRLMARISMLHQDCIKGVGYTVLKAAYEILGRIEEDEVEPKLVSLMGKDKFDLYAGKIWQLKFCEDMARIGIPS